MSLSTGFCGYWGVGVPMGHLLAFGSEVYSPLFALTSAFGMDRSAIGFNLGGIGIWLGLVIGLVVASIVLSTRFHFVTRR